MELRDGGGGSGAGGAAAQVQVGGLQVGGSWVKYKEDFSVVVSNVPLKQLRGPLLFWFGR